MVTLYNFLPNLRSPESVGEIRKSGRAHSARAQGLIPTARVFQTLPL